VRQRLTAHLDLPMGTFEKVAVEMIGEWVLIELQQYCWRLCYKQMFVNYRGATSLNWDNNELCWSWLWSTASRRHGVGLHRRSACL
jgi:hypothetical protein